MENLLFKNGQIYSYFICWVIYLDAFWISLYDYIRPSEISTFAQKKNNIHFCSYNVNHIFNTMKARAILFTDIILFICIFTRNADIPWGHFINRILIKCSENGINKQKFQLFIKIYNIWIQCSVEACECVCVFFLSVNLNVWIVLDFSFKSPLQKAVSIVVVVVAAARNAIKTNDGKIILIMVFWNYIPTALMAWTNEPIRTLYLRQ